MTIKDQGKERIQKILAAAGLGSRRTIEKWIEEGRIQVNNRLAQLGDRISPGDRVSLNGRPVRIAPAEAAKPRVIAYHKPIGEVSTRSDPEGRPTVFDHLPSMRGTRWVAVGRLDLNTAGLLLFTNDGDLANALMHPSAEIDREYAVRILGNARPKDLKRLTDGVKLEDGHARFQTVKPGRGDGANQWFRVVLREGKKREVRRLWEAVGFKVSRLLRTRFGPIELPRQLKRGTNMDLPPSLVCRLYAAAGLPNPFPKTTTGSRKSRR